MSRFRKTLALLAIAFCAFTAGRLYLMLANPDSFASLGAGERVLAFVEGLRFDAATLAMFLAAPLAMMNLPVPFAGYQRWFGAWAWVACAVTCALVLVLIADVNFFGYMGRHLADDLIALENEANTQEVGRHWGATAIAIGALVAIGAAWWRLLQRSLEAPRAAPLGFVLLSAATALAIRGHLGGGTALAMSDAFASGNTARGNLVLNGAFAMSKGIYNHFREEGVARPIPGPEALATLAGPLGAADPKWPFMQEPRGERIARNLVLILLESWQAGHVGAIAGTPTAESDTPEFDALARDGLLFTRCYAASRDSVSAVQAALTGFPRLPGVRRMGQGLLSLLRLTRLGTAAGARGAATIFGQPSDARNYRFDSIAAMLGFREYFSLEDVPLVREYPDPAASKAGWDFDTLSYLRSRIDAAGAPFVAVALTGTTHEPFPDPGEPFRRYPPEPFTDGAYRNTLRYADWSLGEFMRAAREAPWFDETAFLFVGDHATRGLEGQGVRSPRLPDRYHVPLLLYAPGRIEPGVSDRVVSQLDLLPTCMELLGYDEAVAALGRSLLRGGRGFAFTCDEASVALITDEGWVSHDLTQRIEAGGTDDPATLDRIEDLLLHLDAAAYHALRVNHWLPAPAAS